MRPVELSDENTIGPHGRFFYRQSARGAGVGMMIGPPILVAVAIALIRFFPAAGGPPWFDFAFLFCLAAFFVLVAALFFVVGLRRVIYGGEWGCYIDDQYMTWVYPHRMGKQDQQIAVADIQKFVVKVDRRPGDETRYSYLIEIPTASCAIDIECFGRARKLGRPFWRSIPASSWRSWMKGSRDHGGRIAHRGGFADGGSAI